MLPYFYHPNLLQSQTHISLNPETSKHCIQVLRMQKNDLLQLTNGLGLLATAQIVEAHKTNTTVVVTNFQQHEPSLNEITIAIGLLKNNTRFEWFLEKATELGISNIIPLNTQRTIKESFKFDRLNNIVVSAMLQSQQTFLTTLHQPKTLEQVVLENNSTTKLIAHCEKGNKNTISNFKKDNAIILIGPEGDFTNEEIDLALSNNYQPVTLGNTRLRTETAGVVAASLLMIQ